MYQSVTHLKETLTLDYVKTIVAIERREEDINNFTFSSHIGVTLSIIKRVTSIMRYMNYQKMISRVIFTLTKYHERKMM